MCKDDIADDDAAEDLLLHVALCWMMALKQLLLHAVCVKTMDAWISMQGRHRWGRTGQGPAATFCGMWHDGYVQHIFCLFVCVWWVGINNISELSHSFSIVPHAEALHDAWQDWNPQRRISEKKKPKRSAVPEPIVPPKKWHDQKWKGRGWNHQEMHKESGHRVSNLLFGQTWHVCSLHECSSLIAPWQKFYIRCQTSLSGAACVVQHASQQQRWCGLESHGPHAAAAAWCARAERCCALVGQQKGAVQSWHICYI